MSRGQQRPIDAELQELQQELAALTLRVAAIRNRATSQSSTGGHTPIIGDRVSFKIAGEGYTEGVVVGNTAQRLRIRQDRTSNIFLRAPSNVKIL